MTTPDEMERQTTLLTATARYDSLRHRDALASLSEDSVTDLSQGEALEMLALGEVIARKAAYGRQLGVRSARAAGATWAQIGAALGTTKQSAWEAHTGWIDDQASHHWNNGYEGMDAAETEAARSLAGDEPV
jgi:hypothetical protein